MEKICIVCNNSFQTEFPQKKICSENCCKKRHAEYIKTWNEENKDKNNGYKRKWNKNNPDKKKESNDNWVKNNSERCYENALKWHTNNPEKVKKSIKKSYKKNSIKRCENSRQWYSNNKERVFNNHKEWCNENRDHVNMLVNLRRERERKTKGFKDKIEFFREKMSAIGECIYCGTKENLTIEHLIPISKGGTNEINNLFPACKRCNSSKYNLEWIEWYRKKEYYSLERENMILKLFNENVISKN